MAGGIREKREGKSLLKLKADSLRWLEAVL